MKTDKFAALRYRDFKILWIALFISNIGSQMQFTAINWHIFILTNSALALGLIGLSRFVPIAIFSLIGGAVADSHNRKKIILVTQTSLTILSIFLSISTLDNTITPFLIYVISALSAVALAFDAPPRQALIPTLVRKNHLANAISLNVIMYQTSMVLGPALAGIMIKQVGVGIIYLINAVSFLAVIAALLLMKTSGEIDNPSSKVSLKSIFDGIKFVKSRKIIWSAMILDFFSTFFASATALTPIFAEKILRVGSVGFGFLYAAPSIGAMISGYVLAQMGKIKNQGKLLFAAISIYGISTIVFGFSTIFPLSFLALLFIGVGDGISTIIRNVIRQVNTPNRIRGRMSSVNMIFTVGGPQLGEFEAGVVAQLVGAPLSVALGGVGTLAVVGAVAFLVPALRNYRGNKILKE
ncbi:MAG: MFS transporter [Candidatus Aenigmarchaeota archaeon]|nr:MFS transporter [Candidatus Aenigmarchaeota archaeon]